VRNLIAVTLVIAAAGCHWRDATSAAPPSPTPGLPGVQSVAITGPTLVYWKSTSLLQARVTLDDGTTLVSEKAVWTSSDPAVASVDTRGVIMGVSSGETIVAATAGAATGRLTVRVLPDYRGVWRGQLSGSPCGPSFSMTCRSTTGSWDAFLRLEQDGVSVSGFMYYPTDMNPEDGYLFGHVELDGSLVMDRGFCSKDGRGCSPKVTRWRTSLSQDGTTLSGSYGSSFDPGSSESAWELTMQRFR
jgi:hypothetical protein